MGASERISMPIFLSIWRRVQEAENRKTKAPEKAITPHPQIEACSAPEQHACVSSNSLARTAIDTVKVATVTNRTTTLCQVPLGAPGSNRVERNLCRRPVE